MDLKLSDKILIVLGLFLSLSALIAANSTTRFMSLVIGKQIDSSQIVGKIVTSENDTRRKFSGSLSWFPIQGDENIYANDTIYSGDSSSATIDVNSQNDSLKIKLSSNTLIRITQSNGENFISMESGQVITDLKKGQTLNLKVGNQNKKVKATTDSQLEIASKSNLEKQLKSRKGQIEISDENQNATLLENQVADILNEKFEIKKEYRPIEIKFSNISPEEEGFVQLEKGQQTSSVIFEWTRHSEALTYRLMISKDSAMQEIFYQQEMKENKSKLSLPAGLYFWKVDSLGLTKESMETTPLSSFAVGEQNSFEEFITQLNSPKDNTIPTELPQKIAKEDAENLPKVVDFSKPKKTDNFAKASLKIFPFSTWTETVELQKSPNRQVKIKLQKSLAKANVLVKIADNISMRNPSSIQSENPQVLLELKEPGNYYIQAQYIDKEGKLVTNSQAKHQFVYRVEYQIKSPRLISPDNNLKMISIGQSELSIYFEWQKIPKVEKYVFQLSSNPDFSRIISEKIQEENSYYLNEKLLQKVIFWRVKAVYQNSESKWSEIRNIQLK